MHVYTTRCQHRFVHVRRRPAHYVIRRRRWLRGQKQPHPNETTGGSIKRIKTVPQQACVKHIKAVPPGPKTKTSKRYHRGQKQTHRNGATGMGGGQHQTHEHGATGGIIKDIKTLPPGAALNASKRYRRVQHPFPHPQHLYLQLKPF